VSLKKIEVSQPAPKEQGERFTWISRLLWVGAVVMTIIMTLSLVGHFADRAQAAAPETQPAATAEVAQVDGADVPLFQPVSFVEAISREANPYTELHERDRDRAITYTVESGDSIFGIAKSFGISPESLLWANYATLNDDPHNIYIGTELIVPPANGILYKWKQGDTVEAVAGRYQAYPENILAYPGNRLDLTDTTPEIAPDTYVMVPGGWRETKPWVVPTIARGRAGVTVSIPGACVTGEGGAYGSGSFIYPAANHNLSGNDYWSGHLALDFATASGAPLYATDSGVIVFAGWNSSGYGNMVMIDHGNGYASLYAHLSALNVTCGQSVYQGGVVGYAGSTGNSTGPHLHFEIRYFSGFINPWTVLH